MIIGGKLILIAATHLAVFHGVCSNQSSYKFVHEYAELYEHNPNLVHINVACNKLSRTTIGVNITFQPLVNIVSDDDLQVNVVGYQFRSNEYRHGPIDFEMGACSLIESTRSNMPGIFSDSNVTECPLHSDGAKLSVLASIESKYTKKNLENILIFAQAKAQTKSFD